LWIINPSKLQQNQSRFQFITDSGRKIKVALYLRQIIGENFLFADEALSVYKQWKKRKFS
ncbi:hypothetical protein, partial [Caldibacillus debilis]|uniref:hypothetical protein n=1 Tax=Caldibacillus debilis TaxID=301148 RepID=UPI001F342A9E